jgi:hypothetical protein
VASKREQCPDCNNAMTVSYGQSVFEDKVVWYRSFRCDYCGASIEEDGEDTPEYIREIIMQHEGIWSIYLEPGTKKAIAYKVLRDATGLAMSDLNKIVKGKSESIFIGTKVEVGFLKNKMEEQDLRVCIKRINGG